MYGAPSALPVHEVLAVMAQATENILRRPHVLLVEGDEVTAFAVRTLLQQCGYTGWGATV